MEYLEEAFADTTALLPRAPVELARVRALAQLIACDVHPLNNLRVMQVLERDFALAAAQRQQWTRLWMERGFAALETRLARDAQTGRFCHGDAPGLADCVLIPQLYNAHRFEVDLAPYRTRMRALVASTSRMRSAPQSPP